MKNNAVRVIKNSIIYGMGNVSLKIIGLILLPTFLSEFSTKDYGIYGMMEISAQVVIAIFGFGLYNALNRFYYDRDYSYLKKQMVFTVIASLLALNSFFFIITNSFSSVFAGFLFDDSARFYLINLLFISSGLEILFTIPLNLLKLQEKPVYYSAILILKLVITFFLTIYFVVYLKHNVEGIYEAQIAGLSTVLVISSFYILRNSEFKFNFEILRIFFPYSAPLILSSISGVFLVVMDRYMIKMLLGLSEAGIYSLGFKLAGSIKVFVITSIQIAVTPYIFKTMYEPDCKEKYSKILTYTTFLIMIAVMIVSFFSYEFIELMVHKFAKDAGYLEAYSVIPVICYSALFAMPVYIASFALQIIKKTKIIAFTMFLISLINVVLNYIFIKEIGISGAALATLVSQIIFWIILDRTGRKEYNIPVEFRKLFLVFIWSLLTIGASYFINNIDLIPRIIMKLSILSVTPIILKYFGFFEKHELEEIRKIWNQWKNPLDWKVNIKRLMQK